MEANIAFSKDWPRLCLPPLLHHRFIKAITSVIMSAEVVLQHKMMSNEKILPASAQEVDVVLLITFDTPPGVLKQTVHCIESPERQLNGAPQVFVRLGTKVSEDHPSHVGFRIFLRQLSSHECALSGELEEKCHVVSFKFSPYGSTKAYRLASKEDKAELEQHSIAPGFLDTLVGMTGVDYTQKNLYCLEFKPDDQGQFFDISHHGDRGDPATSYISDVHDLIKFFRYATRMKLFFLSDSVLIDHLEQAINHECRGRIAPSWKAALPETALRVWPSNMQDQMAHGSTDLLNVIIKAKKQPLVYDAATTWLESRPDAKQFKDFIHGEYPSMKLESAGKVYPVFLHVPGLCVELPFGASMINRENTYAGVNILHKILRLPISGSNIGIVTFYPAQAEAYKYALQKCHKSVPDVGYDKVKVDILENWVGKTIGIAIVDLVRTANASGNLGWLSQARRLQVGLSLHRDGLIVIGDRKCTLAADDTIRSTKLEKALQWFDDNERIVSVSATGVPLPASEQIRIDMPESTTKEEGLSAHLRPSPNRSSVVKYVGIPGLDLKMRKANTSTTSSSWKKTGYNFNSASDSFARQQEILAAKQNVLPDTKAKCDSVILDGEATKTMPKPLEKLIDFDDETEAVEVYKPPHLRNSRSTARACQDKASPTESAIQLLAAPVVQTGAIGGRVFGDTSVENLDQRFNAMFHSPAPGATKISKPASPVRTSPLEETIKAPAPNTKASIPKASPASEKLKDSLKREGDESLRLPTDKGKDIFDTRSESENLKPTSSDPYMLGSAALDSKDKVGISFSPTFPKVNLPKRTPSPERQKANLNLAHQLMTTALSPRPMNAQPASNGNPSFATPFGNPTARSNSFVFNTPMAQQSPQISNMQESFAFGQQNTEPTSAPFQMRYRAKYQAIRDVFNAIRDPTLSSPTEDQMFRRLADSYIVEDAASFDRIYLELLGIASGLHDGQVGVGQ